MTYFQNVISNPAGCIKKRRPLEINLIVIIWMLYKHYTEHKDVKTRSIDWIFNYHLGAIKYTILLTRGRVLPLNGLIRLSAHVPC